MKTNKNTHQAHAVRTTKNSCHAHSSSQFFTDLKRAISITLFLTLLSPTADVVTAFASTYDSLTATAFNTVEDAGSGETRYALRFGTTLQKELAYDTTLSRFVFDSGLNVKGTISGTNLTIVGTTPSYIVGRTTIGSTHQYQTGATLVVERSSFTGAVNTGTKATLFSTDQMALGQLEGGAYFGRVGLKENQWGLSNYGNTWNQKGAQHTWYSLAMSSDGKIQTAADYNSGYIYVSTDYGNTWNQKGAPHYWYGVAMSSDGKIQTALDSNAGYIYVSTDYGNTWSQKASQHSWQAVSMSSDGKIQTAQVSGGYIYVSTDYGNTWAQKGSQRLWNGIAMSSDGKLQTAVVSSSNYIYVSTDYGNTWTQKAPQYSWTGIAMSSDGKVQTALAFGNKIYVSLDYGNTWNAKDSNRNWYGISMSSDGKIQTATDGAPGYLYVSTDYGNSWTQKGSQRNWWAIAMSSDGKIQTATDSNNGYLYVSYADSYQFGNVSIGSGTAKAMLDVHGTMSSAVLVVSGNASVSGALLTKGTITSHSTVSGANLTFMGATSSYILGNLGVGKSGTINTKLEVVGTISGTTINANSLLTGSTIQGFGLYNCNGTSNKLTYNGTTKKFLCEADNTGVGSGPWSSTGALSTAFDLRYVKKSGDTMTGALTIQTSVARTTAFTLVGSGSYTIAALSGGSIIHTARGNPTLVGNVSTTRAMGITVVGRYAYIADGTAGLRVVDVSTPTAPTVIGTYDTSDTASSVAVAGRYAYVGDKFSGLQIIDVSIPTAPILVSTFSTGGSASGITIVGRYAYVANGSSSTKILDISNPSSPTLMGTYNSQGTANHIVVAGRYAYIASRRSFDEQSNMTIVDVSGPSAPRRVGLYDNTGGDARSIAVVGRYVYLADGASGLRIIDVVTPSSPTLIGTYNTSGSAQDVKVAGRYAYVADGSSGLQVIDVSIPASPTLVGTYDTNGSALGVSILGRYAYVADDSSGLQIIDLNGFSTPTASFGALDLGTLDVLGDARFNKNVTIDRGLNIGDGLYVFGQTSMRAYSGSALTLSTQDKNGAPALNVIGGISGTTLNANTLLTGATIQGFGLYGCQGMSNKLTYNAVTKKFLCEADTSKITIPIGDQQYLKRSSGTLIGGLNIEVTTGDIVKTTSGTTLATDFGKSGSTLSNIESTNDLLDMRSGVVPSSGQGTMASSSVVAGGATKYGSHSIVRSDGKIIVFRGNATNTAYLWDGISTTMSATTRNPLASGTVGSGAISLKKPDGRYIVIAGGSTTTTGVFDPVGTNPTVAGPAVCTTSAGVGTNAALIASGSYLVLCGGSTNWGILNTNTNIYSAGSPALTVGFGTGAMTIGLDDGRFLVFAGRGTSTHWIFNPNVPAVQSWSVINPITSNAPTISVGAFAYRRSDGRFVIVGGAQNASTIYDPTPTASNNYGTFTAQSGAGYGPTATLSDGAGAVYRQDGKLLLMVGGSTTTNIIDRSKTDAGQFTAGPTITGGTPGVGSHMVMNARGQYQIFMGGNTTTTGTYDMGYIIGGNSTVTSTGAIYESECISLTASMNSGATLNWNTNAEDQKMIFKVRTGNGSCPSTEASYKTIVDNGGLIRPTAGDNRVQMKVIFARGAPVQADQEWGLRRGLSQVLYRSIFKDPALYDISIRNSSAFHRTQFDFGTSKDASGPMAINIANDKNRSMQIQLANTVTYPSTYNTAVGASHIFNGAVGSGTALTTASTVGTIVMRKQNGTYVIISGGTTVNAQLFNTLTNSISALGTTPTVATGTGAFAFKRPDGKFLIGIGKDSRTTNIYDPATDTFTAGPNMVDRVGEGSMVIPMSNGRVLIVHGGYRKTSTIYDPFLNVTYTGASMLAAVGRGAMAIPKPDGQYLVIPGASTVTCSSQTPTFLFDPLTNGFRSNAGVALATTGVGPGAVAVERADGNWMIFKGGAAAGCAATNTTTIYNPVLNSMVAGPLPNAPMRHGSTAVQRPDGRWMITNANATNRTQIYEETTGAYTASIGSPIGSVMTGATLLSAVGTGSVALQLDNGKYFITVGANTPGSPGTLSSNLADLGWVSDGYYRSEVITIPDLNSTSTLSWHQTPAYGGVSAHVRTGTSALMLAVNPDREIPYSGAPINPLSGETNIQINFSLKRSVPPNPGIMEDVWYNGGTVPPYRRRTFATPTITDFSIGKDTDLLNLKADKNSLFRVNSNGDVYTGTKGALYSGGADLAERYLSKDDLTPGELVSIDFTNNHSVKRATKPYQMELLGVVSTAPGFVAGAYTKDSFPIALVGRVPVKVSLENGSITAGDYLTSSLIPGYAMRAVKAGRVVGVALESSQDTSAKPCSKSSKAKCTTLMMFVNLGFSPGQPKVKK